jgi:hypothetical protein
MKWVVREAVKGENNSLFNVISAPFSSVMFNGKVQLAPVKWLNVYMYMFHTC